MHSFRRQQAGSHQPLLQAVLVLVLSGASYAWSLNLMPAPEIYGRSLAQPEQMLVQVINEIAENRPRTALNQLDELLAVSPNFRLAQLIKGDLLLARARPIDSLGAGAPVDRVGDLRDEARARLARYGFRPPQNLSPRYLLELPQDHRYALVMDASRSTVFVFANTDTGPRYVADFYMTVGKNGTAKVREGDKKTPLGVYRVTGKMPSDRLTDFYGAGAFPLDYPNEWDQMHGRNGHGIWLHGTPFDTYSRPPRASDGCIVLANDDLKALEQYLQLGTTPVVITESIEWAPAEDVARMRTELRQQLERWRGDWESRDTELYLTHYSRRFSANGANWSQWAAQKRLVNAAKNWIRVEVSDLSLMLYPGESALAVATFDQDYASSNLSNRMRKRQYWIKEDGRWRILFEGAA